jgi:integrase
VAVLKIFEMKANSVQPRDDQDQWTAPARDGFLSRQARARVENRMTSPAQLEVVSSCGRDPNLARRRLQQKGDLFDQGGMWKLRWHEDKIGGDGKVVRGWSRAVHIGPSVGTGKLTEKEARRLGWENFLSKLDAGICTPNAAMTLGNFVEQKFLPEHVAFLKKSGRVHYESMLKHVLPALRDRRLRDTTSAEIQKLVSSMLAKNYSVQTVKHVRTVVSAIFTHAKRLGWHSGDNPAKLVRLPEMVRKEAHALSFDQAVAALGALKSPAREMVLFAILTSMNIAEICGLQWKRVNLTDQFATVDGESLTPLTIAVRRQWYRGEFGSVKAKSRRRNLPIGMILVGVLAKMKDRATFTGPDDPVFSARTGKPVDEHNIARRHLKPIGGSLGMPWLSWHCFRRTHTTLANELGMAFTDRMAMMGHSEARMTALYTADDLQRRRTVLDQMAARLVPSACAA